VVVYRLDPKIQVSDPDCAELFAECGYKGASFTVCNRVDSLPKEGWSKTVKSVLVPEQRQLKLFTDESLRGETISYSKSQECIEDMKFSFAQLLAMVE
jgi:hypothetical protein